MAQDPQPLVSVLDPLTTVEPGAFGEAQVEVKNTGPEVAHYDLAVVADCVPAPWATILPNHLRLAPGKAGNVRIRFSPPLDTATPAGRFPYGVRVQPGESVHQRPSVAEADLVVGAIHAVKVRRPTKTAGRFRGKPVMWVENRGTEPISVRFDLRDEDDAVEGEIFPSKVDLEPGERRELLLKVWPAKTTLLGKATPLPYQVAYRRRAPGSARIVAGPSEAGEVEQTVDGTFERKPILSKLVLLLIALVVVVAGWLIYRWTRPDPPALFAPDPPQINGQAAVEDGVEISFVTQTAGSVQGREIDCATSDEPLPTEFETFPPKEGVASGASRYTMPAPVTDDARCFEVRVIDGSERPSIWSDPIEVPAGEPLPAPTGLDANDPAAVRWDPVDGAESYEIVVTGLNPFAFEQTVANLVAAGMQPGSWQLAVRAVSGDQQSALSETVTMTIAGPDDGDGDGDGDGGSGSDTTGPDGGVTIPEPQGVWVLVGVADEDEGTVNAQQPFADKAGLTGRRVRRIEVQDPETGIRIPAANASQLEDAGYVLPAGAYIMIQDGIKDLETAIQFCDNYTKAVTEAQQRAAEGSDDPEDQLAVEVNALCNAFDAGQGT